MTIVKEIADALELLTQVVNNTRSIVKAVNDGREYLARHHRDANKDFAELLSQMQITVEGLSKATGVISGFRFVIGSEHAAEQDLVRFNKYVIDNNQEVDELKGQISKLKADCAKIRDLRDDLNGRSEQPTWSSLFGLVGLKNQQQREALAKTVSNFYADDERMIDVIEETLGLATKALSDVDESLGEAGIARPHNVPRAARMLGVYSEMFKEPQRQLDELVKSLCDTAVELRGN